MPDAGEDHRNILFSGSGDDFLVTDGTARLCISSSIIGHDSAHELIE